MQSYIIRYVETLKARIEPTGCSIQKALEAELPLMDRGTSMSSEICCSHASCGGVTFAA